MSRRRPRGLAPDELELWQRIAKSATPMRPETRRPFSPEPEPVKPKLSKEPIAPFTIGSRAETALPAHQLAPDLSERLAAEPVAMDRKAHRRMMRGKSTPEARIDLHGMTATTAHGVLTRFILDSHAAGRRLVLVITGKGRPSDEDGPIPTRTGVLRHEVPHWLSLPPLRSAVLQVSEAHRRHGGSGALYVYLRRR